MLIQSLAFRQGTILPPGGKIWVKSHLGKPALSKDTLLDVAGSSTYLKCILSKVKKEAPDLALLGGCLFPVLSW